METPDSSEGERENLLASTAAAAAAAVASRDQAELSAAAALSFQAKSDAAASAAETARAKAETAAEAARAAEEQAKPAAASAIAANAQAEASATAIGTLQLKAEAASTAAIAAQAQAEPAAVAASAAQAKAEAAATAAQASQSASDASAAASVKAKSVAEPAADAALAAQGIAEVAAGAALEAQSKAEPAAIAAVNAQQIATPAAAATKAAEKASLEAAAEAEAQLQNLRRTLENSITASLGGAFQKKANNAKLIDLGWLAVLLAAIALILVIGFDRYPAMLELIKDKAAIEYMLFQLVLNGIALAGPVWLAWVATRRLSNIFAISEDYAYKAAIAQAYQGYRDSVKDSDPLMQQRLFATVVTQLDANPVRFVSERHPGSPLQDLLQQPWMEEALKNPGFREQFINWFKYKYSKTFDIPKN